MTVSMGAPAIRPAAPALPSSAMLDGLAGLAVMAFVGSVLAVPRVAGGWIGLEVLLAMVGVRAAVAVVQRTPMTRTLVTVAGQLLAVVVLIAAWSYAQDGVLEGSVQRAGGAVALQVYNLGLVRGGVDDRGFVELWPVSLVVQSVLVIGILLAATATWSAGRWGLVLFGVAGAVVVARWFRVGADGDSIAAQVLPWFRADGLLIGAAVGVAVVVGRTADRRRLADWSFVAGVWLAGAVFLLPARDEWRQPNQLLALPLAAVAAAAVVAALMTDAVPDPVRRVLAARPLRFVGGRWVAVALAVHPVGVLMAADGRPGWHGWSMFGGQVAFVAFAAWASFELVERPLGALYDRYARRRLTTT